MYVGLGSNVSVGRLSPAAVLNAAINAMRDAGLAVVAESPIFRTPAIPAGPDFANATVAVAQAAGGLAPAADEVLAILHRIEASFERERRKRWGPRTLDLDLLADGDRVLPDRATQTAWRRLSPARQRTETPDRLILPHPRIQDRAFVLVPLAQIAPDWRHPVTGRSVREMLARLPAADRDAITLWDAENAR